MNRPTLISVIALALAGGLSCDVFGSSGPDFRLRARQQIQERQSSWNALNIADYDMDYRRECACPLTARLPVTIEVRNRVISRVVDNTGSTVPPDPSIAWPSADSLFVWALRLIDDTRYFVEVDFDEARHFPNVITGNIPNQVGDEIEHYVDALQPVTVGKGMRTDNTADRRTTDR